MQAPGRSIVPPAPSWAGCFTYLTAWASTLGFPAGGRGLVLGSPPAAWAYVGSSPRRPPGWPKAGEGPCSPPKHSSTPPACRLPPRQATCCRRQLSQLGPCSLPPRCPYWAPLSGVLASTSGLLWGRCPPTASHLHLSLLPPTARLHLASEPASSAPASPSSGSVQGSLRLHPAVSPPPLGSPHHCLTSLP